MKLPIKIVFFLWVFFPSTHLWAYPDTGSFISLSLPQLDSLMHLQDEIDFEEKRNTLKLYKSALSKKHPDSVNIFKKVALLNAKLDNEEEAAIYARKYMDNSLDFSLMNDGTFYGLTSTKQLEELEDKYKPKVGLLHIFYFSIALIGFFIAFTINFRRKSDSLANIFVSGFVFVHSLFILEFALYATNLRLKLPHTYFMASTVALLYGPLLYLYFKRVVRGSAFEIKNLVHFLPNLILLLFLLPLYFSTANEKIKMMLGIDLSYKSFFYVIIISKIVSLVFYGYLIGKYQITQETNEEDEKAFKNTSAKSWKKNIYLIHLAYVVSYLIYGITISGVLGSVSDFVYHFQVVTMSVMVLYIAFMAYVQPEILSNNILLDSINAGKKIFTPKYQSSGLTDAYSQELSKNLMILLNEEKIFKESDLNLEKLSERLNTTRHNTSQVINEHFGMNFFELINKFRINEVIDILKDDIYGSLHIIDVAYEVGYNNKVTFNKAFKKETSQTPSEFIKSYRENPLVNFR